MVTHPGISNAERPTIAPHLVLEIMLYY